MAIFTVTSAFDDVRAPRGTLRHAIRNARAGDTIRFSSALKGKTIKLKRRHLIDKDLFIDASDAPGLTLDAQKKSAIFSVEGNGISFGIKGLTLRNAFHKHNGGAIRADVNTTLLVENSDFRNNVAGYGGAIWAKTNADVTVINSKFHRNRSTEADDTSAGAISVFDGSKLTVKRSEFVGNEGISGGAIGTIFSKLTIDQSFFKDNTSVRWSGAVHADGASVPKEERYYGGDKPRADRGERITILNSQFHNNKSGGRGGAVGIWGYDQDYVSVINNDFVGNRVTKDKKGKAKGGALRVSGKDVVILDSYFANNTSEEEGGAIWNQGESKAKIENTRFEDNWARKGGAIYNYQWNGVGAKIAGATFKNNHAQEGSVVYKEKGVPLHIANSTFSGNGQRILGGNLDNVFPQTIRQTNSSPSRLRVTPPRQPSFAKQTPDTLVAWMSFDEETGKAAADRSTGGKRNTAQLMAGASWNKGIQGGAVSFEAAGQFAKINNSKDINLGVHQQRTVSFWFNASEIATGARKQLLYKEGGDIRGLNVYLDDGRLYAGGWNEPARESEWDGTWLSSDDVISNQWHHVALVLDGSDRVENNALTAYLDGQKIGAGKGSQLWSHSGAISLGSVVGGTKFHDGTEPTKGHGLVGAIDDLKIFNDALNAQQISELTTL